MTKRPKPKKRKVAHKSTKLPQRDRKAEQRFHHFLDLWNTHIREQINVHKMILQGKQSLKQHLSQTRKIHQKFLKQLSKI